jgi:cobalt-zinc-cadmium efflux system membrane fusion protein
MTSNPSRLMRIHATTLALALGAVTMAGCSGGRQDASDTAKVSAHDVTLSAEQRQHIRLQTVALGSFHPAIETTGRVDFDNERATSVIAPFTGPVVRLRVAPGDRVAKDQVLATVASSDFAAAVGAYRKALVAARNARHIADMDQDLLAHHGVSAREAAQAATDAVSAEADRDAARQALLAMGVDEGSIRVIQAGRAVPDAGGAIRAPIAGTVVERLINPGQLLQAGSTACFTVADLSHMWVMAQVTPAEVARVHLGDSAEIRTGDGGTAITGTVTSIGGVVNPDTGLVDVRVSAPNPDDALRKQMYVNVTLSAKTGSQGLLVPVSAILRDDENLPFVYVAQPDGSFARRHVTQGQRTGDRVVVDEGLQAGDKVVVDGGLFMQFMQNQ